jgi:cell division protease FtsH
MVTEYGMSAKLGAVRYGQEQGDPFLGRSMGVQSDYSHEVAREIDEEVRNLIEAAHTEAWSILNEYRDALDVLAAELLEHETLTRKDLERILADVKKRPRITTFDEFGDRVPSDKPPIKTPAELAAERGEPWPPEPPSLTKPAHRHPQYPGRDEVPAAGAYQPGPQPQYQPAQSGRPANGYPAPQPVPSSEPLPGFPPPAPYPGGPRHATRPDYGAPAGWSAPGWPPRDQSQHDQNQGQVRPQESGDNGAGDPHRGEHHMGDSQPRDGYGTPEPPPTQPWEGPAGRH